jgi:hypothetical protein
MARAPPGRKRPPSPEDGLSKIWGLHNSPASPEPHTKRDGQSFETDSVQTRANPVRPTESGAFPIHCAESATAPREAAGYEFSTFSGADAFNVVRVGLNYRFGSQPTRQFCARRTETINSTDLITACARQRVASQSPRLLCRLAHGTNASPALICARSDTNVELCGPSDGDRFLFSVVRQQARATWCGPGRWGCVRTKKRRGHEQRPVMAKGAVLIGAKQAFGVSDTAR